MTTRIPLPLGLVAVIESDAIDSPVTLARAHDAHCHCRSCLTQQAAAIVGSAQG